MIKIANIFILIILLNACVLQEKKALKLYGVKPEWVNSAPISNENYIGIGSSNKNNPEYKNMAIRIALDNLSNEISVVVSSESVLNTLEINQKFQQEFSQNIQMNSKADLEGYELMDTWEDENNYYVYYTLSKLKHKQIRSDKIEIAKSRAKDLYTNGLKQFESNEYQAAFTNFVLALNVISNYLDQEINIQLDNKNINLGNEILNSINSLQSEIVLKPSINSLKVKFGDIIGSDIIYVKTSNKKGNILSGIPILFEYNATYTKTEYKTSDNNGIANFDIGKITNKLQNQEIIASVNFKQLLENTIQNRMLIKLINVSNSGITKINLSVSLPKVYIQGQEKFAEKPLNNSLQLLPEIKKALLNNNFEIASDSKSADLVLIYDINLSTIVNTDGLNTILAQGNFEVIQAKRMVYSTSIPSQKASHLSENEAINENILKLSTLFNSRLIPQFANQYFQY